MKSLSKQYLIEYETKLNAYQEKLDEMQYQQIPISRADENEFYRLMDIVKRLKKDVENEI